MKAMGLESDKFPPLAVYGLEMVGEEDERAGAIRELRQGSLCPQCGQEKLDYDGMLNLSCPGCGYTLGGCFT